MTPPIRNELDTMSYQPCLTSYYKEVELSGTPETAM